MGILNVRITEKGRKKIKFTKIHKTKSFTVVCMKDNINRVKILLRPANKRNTLEKNSKSKIKKKENRIDETNGIKYP